ncbi:MAG: hypothetical protein ACI4GW_01515 [Lachnospiraceae bacterium]
MIVKYKGQKLTYIEDFHGKEVLRIMNPNQINMPGMTFVGGYPNEYCIFIDELPVEEQSKIRKQLM